MTEYAIISDKVMIIPKQEMNTMTDREISLVNRVKGGDVKAYQELYTELYPRLSKLVADETANPSVCDTVLQAAFDKAHYSIRFLNNPETFEQMIISLILAECKHNFSKAVPTTIQGNTSFSESAPQQEEEYDPDKASYDYRSSVYAQAFSSIEQEPDFNSFMSFFTSGKVKTESSSPDADSAQPDASDNEEEHIKTLVLDEGYAVGKEKEQTTSNEELIKLICSRRSVKNYSDKPVPKEISDAVVQAGLYAPNGMGKQSPVIIAVTDKKIRDRLSDLNRKFFAKDIDPFYGAPAVLVVLADKSVPTYLYDGSLTMGNMLLAAHAMGIGGCWIHRAKQMFESEEGLEILKELGIEGEFEGIGNCVLGYPAGEPKEAPERKPNRVFYL